MGILTGLLERRSLEKPTQPITSQALVAELLGPAAAAGVNVTASSAMQVSTVFACVRILAETIASLPLPVYRRLTPRGKERDRRHPLYRLLHDLPNPYMTSMELRENLVGHVNLWGNAFTEVDFDGAGQLRALWPLRPDRVTIEWRGGRRYYVVQVPNQGPKGLPAERVWHVRGFGTDGDTGLSVIGQAREAIGLAMATERFGAKFFSNDSRPGGVLQTDKDLSPDKAKKLKASWEAAYGGLEQAWRVAVLEDGLKWQQIGIPPEDAQFLETRKFQVTEIARWFRIPPHMVADLDRATFSNIEHQSIEFVVHTIRPWLVRIEQSILRDLLTPSERETWFAEHLIDGLMRGDFQTRMSGYATGRQWGWYSADDIREMENMNPLPDGQGNSYLVPLNMVPADELGALGSEPTRGLLLPGRAVQAPGILRARKKNHFVARQRIARSYRRLVINAAERILRREEADVMRQAEKMLARRDLPDFLRWLETFYEDHSAFVERSMLPVLLSLADQIQADAAEEIGIEAGMTDALEDFVRDYARVAGDRYARSSFGQLRQVLEQARDADEDLLEALRGRFEEWGETRPGKLAATHTVRGANAVTKETWRDGGIRHLEWVTNGENCPYCNGLSGKIVGIDETFLREGDDYQPEGAEAPLRPHRNVGHAPAHLGCDCGIAPA